ASGRTTTDGGGMATFTIALTSQPTASVTIGLSSSDMTEGTAAPDSVSFTSANWNTAQTVTVTGVDDFVADGPVGYTIVTAAATRERKSDEEGKGADVGGPRTDKDTDGKTGTRTSGRNTKEGGGRAPSATTTATQPE